MQTLISTTARRSWLFFYSVKIERVLQLVSLQLDNHI